MNPKYFIAFNFYLKFSCNFISSARLDVKKDKNCVSLCKNIHIYSALV